ncbi:MAG: hypothetical protein J6R77_05340 [Clostridia bacterium]|nr:hypothetical protein [Clostridia bacterium]
MKRTMCLLLCGLLLLAGCQTPAPQPAETPTTIRTRVGTTATAAETRATTVETTVPATTITEAPTTTTTLSDEEWLEQTYRRRIDEFLQAWKAGDSEALNRFTGSKEMATLLAEGVKVESYRLVHATDDKPHRLTLSVSASEVPSVPVGESEWWIRVTADYDGLYVELCPMDEDYNARWWRGGTAKGLPVWFCGKMATELELFDTVEDYSRLSPEELGARGGTFVRLYNACVMAFQEKEDMPPFVSVRHLSEFVRQVLGVTVTDFSASDKYIPATDIEEAQVELGAYGGKWHYAGLVDYTEQDGVHIVTLRYYADTARLVEAVTMRYTVGESENGMLRLLSSERLSGGTYPPAWGNT